MKHYNFDEVIERHGTSCVKFDRLKEMFGDENLIPLWVADMDFRTPDFIVEALKKRCERDIRLYIRLRRVLREYHQLGTLQT